MRNRNSIFFGISLRGIIPDVEDEFDKDDM
jgi:hypothetical protein